MKGEDYQVYFFYEDTNGDNNDDNTFTSRNIQLGSTKKEVIEAYGVGNTNIYNKETDKLYVLDAEYFGDYLKGAESYMYYKVDNNQIRFYFDKDDKVMLYAFITD